MYSYIKKQSKIIKVKHGINAVIQQYAGKTGAIKGIKRLKKYTIAYLIEFLDRSRIWVTEEEFHFLT